MNNVPNEILERIKKLLSRTIERGCTPAEAEAAAHSANALIARWNLTQSEVEFGDLQKEVIKHVVDSTYVRVPFGYAQMLVKIGRALNCYVIRENSCDKNTGFIFVGNRNDVEFAIFLSDVLIPAARNEARLQAYQSNVSGRYLRRHEDSFLYGVSMALEQRLMNVKDNPDLTTTEKEKHGQLVVLKDQANNKFIEIHYPTLQKKVTHKQFLNDNIVEDGKAYGKDMAIPNAMKSKDGKAPLALN